MKIVEIETYPVGAGWKNWLFVRVLTDDDVYGVGEATLNGFGRTCEAAVHELAKLAIGRDPRQVRQLVAQLYDRVSNEGGHVHRTAIAGIEVACWDILGKALDVPIYQLFGGRVRDTVACYANGWYREGRSPEAFATASQAVVGPRVWARSSTLSGLPKASLSQASSPAAARHHRCGPYSCRPQCAHPDRPARSASPIRGRRLHSGCSDLGRLLVGGAGNPRAGRSPPPPWPRGRRAAWPLVRISHGGQFLTLLKNGGVSHLPT